MYRVTIKKYFVEIRKKMLTFFYFSDIFLLDDRFFGTWIVVS